MKKAALITGAAQRIGREMAEILSSLGWEVIIHYHRSEQEARSLAARLPNSTAIQADLTNPYEAHKLIECCFARYPNLRLLINNASIFHPATFLETSIEQLDYYYSLQVRAPFFLIQKFVAHLPPDDKVGHIINVLDNMVNNKKAKLYFPYLLTKKSLSELTSMLQHLLGTIAPQLTIGSLFLGKVLPKNQAVLTNEKRGELKSALEFLIKSGGSFTVN